MAAARTIPDTQKRRTYIAIIMSCHTRSSSPKLSGDAKEPHGRKTCSVRSRFLCAQFREFTSAQHSLTGLCESAKICPTDLGGSIRTLLLLGLLAAIQSGAADPRIGSWTLVSAQSSL